MMRWIVGTSLKFRFLVVAAACGDDVLRRPAAAEHAGRRLPRVRAARGRDPDAVSGPVGHGGRGARHRSDRAGPGRHARAWTSCAPSRSPSCRRSSCSSSRAPTCCGPGSSSRNGSQLVTPTLPTWAAPPVMIQPLSSTSRMMKIGLSSKTHSVIDMSMIAYWKIRARLLRVPGVANVAIWGERLQMYQVQVDPKRMRRTGHGQPGHEGDRRRARRRAARSTRDGGYIGSGGFVETPNQRLASATCCRSSRRTTWPRSPSASRDGQTLRLADVADVVDDHQPLVGDAVINDGPGLMLIVEKLPWANTARGHRRGRGGARRDAPRPARHRHRHRDLPAGHVHRNWPSRTSRMALLIGCLLVILDLGAFLFEWRTALISSVPIPLSLVAAGLVLYCVGRRRSTR